MDNEYLKRIYGLLESGATLGTGAVSGLVGLPYGLYKGVTSGAYGTPEAPRIAAREAQQFMERNTYQPRTAEGQANLQQLAGLLEASKLPPVMPEASLLAAIPKQAYAAQAERAGMAAEKAIAPVVTRTMERGGLPAQLLDDLSQGSIRPMDVWHGSPHKFDKFDASKIGSGEGSQQYGYGLYLAQAPDEANQYVAMASNPAKRQYGLTKEGKEQATLDALIMLNSNQFTGGDVSKLADLIDRKPNAFQYPEKMISRIKEYVNDRPPAFLYKVDLPDDQIENMLDFDKQIKEQTQAVRTLAKEYGVDESDLGGDLLSKIGKGKQGSEIMSNAGLSGIKFLDLKSLRGSRETPAQNFVIFPNREDILTIKEINDKPIGGLLGQSKAAFDVTKKDASELFGAGAQRVMYQDPKSGGTMEVLVKPDGTASVLSLEVPETSRGKGIGQSLQAQVMQDYPEMMGQVSSKAAAKTAYRLGRRPPFKPDATLEDVYKMMDEDSSVNLVSPEMQKRFKQSLLD